jgi:hypothetical protein
VALEHPVGDPFADEILDLFLRDERRRWRVAVAKKGEERTARKRQEAARPGGNLDE